MHNWHTYSNPDETAQAAAEYLAELIEHTLQHHALCNIALPGGNTPALCFSYLIRHDINWSKVHWYLGDERCLPVGHADRNDNMVEQNLWSKINADAATIHRIPAELGAVQAANAYAQIIDQIDLHIALLGMGEDGHTASLFPNNIALNDNNSVVPVFNSPKPPPERVSLSINTLKHAKHRIVLTTGDNKKHAITQIHHGDDLPINRIGDIEWFVDEAAMRARNNIAKHFS